MNDFIIIIAEGQNEETAKSNFNNSFQSFLKTYFDFEINNNNVVIEDKVSEEKIELKSNIYNLDYYYMFITAIPLNNAEKLLNENYYFSLKNNEIIFYPNFKIISFLYKKDRFINILNGIALNVVNLYRTKYEKQNKELNINEFPMIIKYKYNYEIPTAIYKEVHNFEKYIGMFVNKI